MYRKEHMNIDVDKTEVHSDETLAELSWFGFDVSCCSQYTCQYCSPTSETMHGRLVSPLASF